MGIQILAMFVIIMLVLLVPAGAVAGALLGARQRRLEAVDLGAVLGAILVSMAVMTIAARRLDFLPLLLALGGTAVGCALMRAREPRILVMGLGCALGGALGDAFGALGEFLLPVWLVGSSTIVADQIAYLVKRRRHGEIGDPASPPAWIRAERVVILAVVLDLLIGDEIAIVFAGLHMGSGAGALVGGLGRVISRGLFDQLFSPNWIFSILSGAAGGALAGLRIRQLKYLGPVLAVLTMAALMMAFRLWLWGRSDWYKYGTVDLLERAAMGLAGGYVLSWAVTAWARLRTRT